MREMRKEVPSGGAAAAPGEVTSSRHFRACCRVSTEVEAEVPLLQCRSSLFAVWR